MCSEIHRSRLIAAVVSPAATADRTERSRSVSAGRAGASGVAVVCGAEAGAWNTAPLDTWRRTEAMSTVCALLST